MIQISVVIATWNRRHLLARTLPTLLDQQFPADNYEIIIVVDGSTDGTAEFLRAINTDRHLTIIEQENRGQAAAINVGIKAARGNLVLFLDDDILCSPSLLAQHVSAPRSEKGCLVFGPVLVAPGSPDALAADWADIFCGKFFADLRPEDAGRGWHDCMASANSSAPRDVLLSNGGVDESFGRGNDYDFGMRLLQHGYRFVYQPDAVVHQIFTKTRSDVLRDARDEGISELRLSRKHPEARMRSHLAPVWAQSGWKRALMRSACRLPVSPEPALRVLATLCSLLRPIPLFRRMALSSFLLQQTLISSRSAIKEVGSWRKLRDEFGKRLPVLMYHNVGPYRQGCNPWLTVPPRIFEKHLRWLADNGYQTIHVSDWICYLKHGEPLPDKPVVLTFDDAFADAAEYGFPLLNKYGFTGTVFVVTNEIDGTNRWDAPLGQAEQPLMTAEQIRYWSSQDIEFGSHGVTHADLTACSDNQLRHELERSRAELTEVVGAPVNTMAYPYGYINERVISATRLHYDAAFTCISGLNDMTTDLMLMRRATVESRMTRFDLACFVRFGRTPLLTARIHLRGAARRMKRILEKVANKLSRSNQP